MPFKSAKLAKLAILVTSFLGIKEVPIAEGKVTFSDDQKTKLEEKLTADVFNKMIEAFERELATSAQQQEMKTAIEDLLKETEIPQDDLNAIIEEAKVQGKDDQLAVLKAIQKEVSSYKEMIAKLSDEGEDKPLEVVQKHAKEMKHSATHVFGSGKIFDAIEGRPWNAAAIKGLTTSATDYSNPVVIEKLNGDADHYFRENPEVIKSLHRDNFELPAFWPKRLRVDDQVTSASILTTEITQGRKFGWLPKNVQEIETEVGKIYPVQIDAEWEGAQLQEIETMWLNTLMNREGSQPEKMTFVRFLVMELMKRARVEDRISTLNGIFVQTPKDATKPGRFINRQNGLFYQIQQARDVAKKYRAFAMGEITPANVYDYFHSDVEGDLGFIKRLPLDVVNSPNLVVYMHHKVWNWYKAKYKELNGTNQDYKGKPAFFEDYPNIRIETFTDQESISFVFATLDDNIEILENIPSEKSAYRFQTLLRKVHLMADYKLGVRLIHIGREVNDNDPDEFKVQSIWSNDVPIFPESKYIPAFDNLTGKLSATYKNLAIDDAWNTDITDIVNTKPGMIVKIKGNTSSGAKNVKHNNAKIKLAGNADFPLNNGGTLTLYIQSDLVALELSRTNSAPEAPSPDLNFDANTIDATATSVFRYVGTTNRTLTEITGGVQDKTIRIYGKAGNTFTVANVAGLIVVGSNVVLDAATDYIDLVKVDGVWYKSNAVTA